MENGRVKRERERERERKRMEEGEGKNGVDKKAPAALEREESLLKWEMDSCFTTGQGA